jgi:hypothetical protein
VDQVSGPASGQLELGDQVEFSYWTEGIDGKGTVIGWNPFGVVINTPVHPGSSVEVPWDGVWKIGNQA